MKQEISLLLIEDSEDDALLLARFLKQHGYIIDLERVDNAQAMQNALQQSRWDLIIADYQMPLFSGIEALHILKQSGLDIPFIIVSGVIGEETAVAAMRAGAHDYLMKENLMRLPPAIERERKEAAVRRAHRQAAEHAKRLSHALEQSASLVLITGQTGIIEYLNASFSHITGYTAEEMIGQQVEQWLSSHTIGGEIINFSALLSEGAAWRGELNFATKAGESYWATMTITPLCNEEGVFSGFLVVQEDISEQKRLEDELRRYMSCLELLVDEQTDKLIEINQLATQRVIKHEKMRVEFLHERDLAYEESHLINQIQGLKHHTLYIALNHEFNRDPALQLF